MFLSHLADGVHRAGGHWEVADGSHLRGAALHDRSREQKKQCERVFLQCESVNHCAAVHYHVGIDA